MQLFSIGLWELELDGTRKLDTRGRPIPTYTNDDIVSFSRAWTGFDDRPIRGNLEQKRISQANQVDPTRVRPERRDMFPKMNLYGGYLGDAYPLCSDLPQQSFLRPGAKYRFLGSEGKPELINGRDHWGFGETQQVHRPLFSPDLHHSHLHKALCGLNASSGEHCRFQSSIVLDTALPCHGQECDLDTVRVVKITTASGVPYYYEYVRVPCVSLAFFVGAEGGRYIENTNWLPSHGNEDELIERVCADPQSAVAAPGCCTPEGGSCFEYRCAYVDERVTLARARERCEQTTWPNAGVEDVTVRSSGGGKIVSGEAFVPEVQYKGGWYPICGHHFWDSQRGAETVCRNLGFMEGKLKRTKATFDVPAMQIGKCESGQSLSHCTKGGNQWGNLAVEDCKAGSRVGISITCTDSLSDAGEWSLFPHEYRTGPTECPSGSSTASEEQCEIAATVALAAAGKRNFDTPKNFAVGSWSNMPHGCIVNTHDPVVRFNKAKPGTGHDDYKIICKGKVEGAANYHNVSALFCPRLRRKCWWKNENNCDDGYGYGKHQTTNHYWWTDEKCVLQAQVNVDGTVSVVHPDSESIRRVGENSGNWFRVRWTDGKFPQASGGCGPQCRVVAGDSGDTCLCYIDMTVDAVFNDITKVPDSQTVIEDMLRIGASNPELFDEGTYALCETAACRARAPAVQVYTRGSAQKPLLDQDAIFAVVVNETRVRYLANKHSTVTLAGSFSFRNPPTFMHIVDPSQRDALYETEALLDHLFHHVNVAPFISKSIIQAMVTANPSPRYIRSVATAFKTGSYDGHTFSGEYGDLGALIAAILLDDEARSLTLAADPTHGRVRDPLVKVLHLLRGLEFTSHDGREAELSKDIHIKLGQAVYKSPTVFSFYRPDYVPEGAVQMTGLVSPAAQLGVLPYTIGYIDGITSLVFDGLSGCAGGFGGGCNGNRANSARDANLMSNDGYLSFEPTDVSSAEAVIDELALVLTAGRLDDYTRTVVTQEYRRALNMSSCPVDRSEELCGRLSPKDQLFPGEQITNAKGEVLCMTRDGVARHIGADGREVFSTAYLTRGGEHPLRYHHKNGALYIGGRVNWGISQNKWVSSNVHNGLARDAFHSFLNGPCVLINEEADARVNLYDYTGFGNSPEVISCNAASTCDAPPRPPRSEAYKRARALTDADYGTRITQ